MDAGLKNVSLSNFHGVAVRIATIYGKYFPTNTGSKPPPPKRARSRSANLHPYLLLLLGGDNLRIATTVPVAYLHGSADADTSTALSEPRSLGSFLD